MSIPSSTYRIQLHKDFNFHKLEEILDYLHQLGISTIYASPITTSTKGSQHGYDVTNPLLINPEIGTEEQLEKLAGLLKAKNMNWLQDIVPNHMAYESNNTWLWDVLERGKNSEYYRFFDIDTDHSVELTGTKIMAPFLGKTLTECLRQKELKLEYRSLAPPTDASAFPASQGFVISYYEKDYPVSIFSYPWICTIAEGYPTALLASMRKLEQFAARPAADWAPEKEKWLGQVTANEEWRTFLHKRIAFFNEQPSLLAELLDSQHYILTHGHLAASRINYRRFFTVSSLICLRMEDPLVFSAYHAKIHEWYRKGYIQGLRIDHIDGLAFPFRYIRELKQLFGEDCYTVAEKILAADEQLSEDWQLEGTTGYDFLSMINQLLTDENGYRELTAFYREKINECPPYEEIVFAKKYNFLKTQMGGEWNNLIDILLSLPLLEAGKMDKDQLKEALAVLISSFPVYRVYPKPSGSGNSSSLTDADRNVIDQAFSRAAAYYPAQGSRELGFLQDILLESSGNRESTWQKRIFQARLMQFTGPLAAKGIEDTTFYVYNPLISRNEVGDSPAVESMTPAGFHQKMAYRQKTLPYSQNATATHDTKRGEDARIRLNWLSAIPEEWVAKVTKWQQLNRPFIRKDQQSPSSSAINRAPSANDEYLIYQSLLGSFPIDLLVTDAYRERFHQYLTKALREEKTNTNYDNPNEAYEKNCHDFVSTILQRDSAFLEDFIPFVFKVIRKSAPYSLSQELIKLTAPGIPDIYQGAESWDLSLVDPDNRNPVDYLLRKKLLAKIKEQENKGVSNVLDFVTSQQHQGAGKLFTLYKTLTYRNRHPQVFTAGDYIPVGAPTSHLSYLRRYKDDWVLVIVPLIRQNSEDASARQRIPIHLPADAPSDWTNLFTGDRVSAAEADNSKSPNGAIPLELKEILSKFPVALLGGKSLSR